MEARREAARGYRPRRRRTALQGIVDENLEELFQSWDVRYRKTYGPSGLF
jgi:hypothetical protein